ncbi:MAG: energy transducer TonB [Chitinophagaceae bacterium]|jgi:protein TonB|nr:energy transducer TonB [Chitinophagaceae bacterium]
MEKNKILQADLLDIIFDDRNKSYGAYELRRTYPKRIAIALSGMFVTVAAIAGITMMNEKDKTAHVGIPIDDVFILKADEKRIPEKVVPPPPKKIEQIKTVISSIPKIVEKVQEDKRPPEQETLDKVQIGAFNRDGEETDVIAPPVEKTGTGNVVTPKVKEDIDDTPVTRVEIEAKYPGGVGAWANFLKRNLRSDVPVENGASPGKYSVLVSFIVDRDGNTSEIKAEKDPGYGCAAEAIRVIKSSGKWQPAEQNGHQVIYRQKQVITFEVQDN